MALKKLLRRLARLKVQEAITIGEIAIYRIIKTKSEYSKFSVFIIAPYIYRVDGSLGYIYLSKGKLCRTSAGELEDIIFIKNIPISKIKEEDIDPKTAINLILYPYFKMPDKAIELAMTLLSKGTLVKDGRITQI